MTEKICEYKVLCIKVDLIDEKIYEKFLEKYSKISKRENIICVLEVRGGVNFNALKIGKILMDHVGDVIAFVPKHALSGGTSIALACGSIILGNDAMLSPCDHQIYPGGREEKELKKFKDRVYKKDKEYLESVVHRHDLSKVVEKEIIRYFYKPDHETLLTYEMVKDIGLNVLQMRDLPSKLVKHFRKLERFLSLI
ncbi:MAG: hypothetical protein Harvfovirus2_15 [Harvfovirus sp.]|uniref:Serine dehydrogenase proteinase n=1 Tax=Harvfovirus sp. TaxID=2487768 RepID=A0A3G4ZZX9_9VIRU|nr:MAG: hypothetical protein Harvfovirus2_15 [Harvfovirus sp.]